MGRCEKGEKNAFSQTAMRRIICWSPRVAEKRDSTSGGALQQNTRTDKRPRMLRRRPPAAVTSTLPVPT